MITFDMLSAFIRSLFALWTLFLCVINIVNGVLGTARKRYAYTAFFLLLFAPVYFMWQVIFDYSLFGEGQKVSDITSTLCNLPVLYWCAALVILTVLALLLLIFNIRYDRTYITPGTIKVFLDKMPCGICCWRKNGRILFSNICMNRLCAEITGASLLNGNQFRDALEDRIITVGDSVWRFACKETTVNGEQLYEMIASDITDEYAKTAALKKDRAELSRLNQELKEYYLSIDESVKRQEILQAKINIHDEMNRLMLSTVAADTEDAKALDNIFSLWEKNALLLCMEADNKTTEKSVSIESLANALGVRLIRNGELPDELSGEQKELFFFAVQEAIINAVKHAKAKTVSISFDNSDEALICRISNDGDLPDGEVRFEGGLANLASLAKKNNATIHTETGDDFSLVLSFFAK